MSRWQRRSKEEKERIYREARKSKSRSKREIVTVVAGGVDNEEQLKLLKEREIPLRCAVHGWVKSKRYIITKEECVFSNGMEIAVKGRCPRCGKKMRRFIVPSIVGLDNMMIFGLVFDVLKKQGRLEDRREVKD